MSSVPKYALNFVTYNRTTIFVSHDRNNPCTNQQFFPTLMKYSCIKGMKHGNIQISFRSIRDSFRAQTANAIVSPFLSILGEM